MHRIVITGGPCAGKTTAMAKLSLRLQNMGFDVFVVVEVRDAAWFPVSELQYHEDGVGATTPPPRRRRGRQSRSAQVATLTITGGAKPGNYSQRQHRDWEVSVLKLQMALEDNFRDIAEKCSLPEGRHAVLLMDRGRWTSSRTWERRVRRRAGGATVPWRFLR